MDDYGYGNKSVCLTLVLWFCKRSYHNSMYVRLILESCIKNIFMKPINDPNSYFMDFGSKLISEYFIEKSGVCEHSTSVHSQQKASMEAKQLFENVGRSNR